MENKDKCDDEMAQTFAEADKNNDGVLFEDEFIDYMNITSKKEKEQFGDAAKFDEKSLKVHYAKYYNPLVPDHDGVTLADLKLVDDLFENL